MNVVAFGSGSGTNIEALLIAAQKSALFRVVAVCCDRPCRCEAIAASHRIPSLTKDFRRFFHSHGSSNTKDKELRTLYDREFVTALQLLAEREGFAIDLLVLAGYMRLVHSPFLDAFPRKIINVHPGDLSKCRKDGSRPYIGIDAVAKALREGEKATRSSVILVNGEMDGGLVLVSGPWVDVEPDFVLNKKSIAKQQKRQKEKSDWPALTTAVRLIAEGRLSYEDNEGVALDGKNLGLAGYQCPQQRSQALCVG